MIYLITTPTRAYEAYNFSDLHVLKQQLEHSTKQEIQKLPQPSKNQPQNATLINQDLCSLAAQQAEKNYQIKPQLLQTIASVESGRWNEKLGKRIAWPWTIQANGRGYYYQTKQEAVAAIKQFYARGITNIDVGCMQINMRYHRHAFNSIEDTLDPQKNVNYSAKFLLNLYKNNGHNWQKTAMQYHSKNYQKGLSYKNRLEKHYAEHINPTAQKTLFE